jgi:hypothetical protein
MSRGLRKKGHRPVKMVRDSRASALDIGTGDDFKTAVATSGDGRARRLRAESPTFVLDGPAKSLNNSIKRRSHGEDKDLHPDALRNAL